MLSFRVKGVCVGFDFAFFTVITLFFYFDRSGMGLLSLAASALHEIGHLLVMLKKRLKPERIVFGAGGITISKGFGAECSFSVLSAGCAVNFLIFGVTLATGTLVEFGMINLIIGIFNLLPIGYFDGKKILQLMFTKLLKNEQYVKLAAIGRVILPIAAAFTAISLFFCGKLNFTAFIAIIYIFVVDIATKK